MCERLFMSLPAAQPCETSSVFYRQDPKNTLGRLGSTQSTQCVLKLTRWLSFPLCNCKLDSFCIILQNWHCGDAPRKPPGQNTHIIPKALKQKAALIPLPLPRGRAGGLTGGRVPRVWGTYTGVRIAILAKIRVNSRRRVWVKFWVSF